MQVPVRIPFPFFFLDFSIHAAIKAISASSHRPSRGEPSSRKTAVGIQIKRAASFVRSAKHLVFLRFELVSIESEFHPGHPLYRSFAPALTSWRFAEPAGVYRHLNREHRRKETTP
jgi:hypothetical protein